MVAGIYYDLQVDYATQIWEEFLKSIGNTNVVDGISYARYLSLILQYVYEKEGIEVSNDEETAEFSLYHFPKSVEEAIDVFPTISRIPNSMLKNFDPSNPVLVAYQKHVNPSIETGVLLPKSTEGPSKTQQGSKKDVQLSLLKVSAIERVAKSPHKVLKEKRSRRNMLN